MPCFVHRHDAGLAWPGLAWEAELSPISGVGQQLSAKLRMHCSAVCS